MDKIRSLEGLLAEHEVIKREVGSLRSQMEDTKREMDGFVRSRGGSGDAVERGGRVSAVAAMLEAREAEDDDDDAASVSSVDTVTLDSDLRASPKRPHPNGIVHPTDAQPRSPDRVTAADHAQLIAQNTALTSRLEAISIELNEASKLGQALRTQYAEAAETIRALEDRVAGLEKEVVSRVAAVEASGLAAVESKWEGWKAELESGWKKQQESWETERSKLLQVIKNWEDSQIEEADPESQEQASSSSPALGKKPKPSRPRRKRRGSGSPLGSPVRKGSTKGNGKPGAKRLAELPGDEVASDSDSTAILGSGSTDDLAVKGRSLGKANQPTPILDVGFESFHLVIFFVDPL